MRITHPFLLKYTSERPEIKKWDIQRINGKVALGFYNFKNEFVVSATGSSEQDIANRIKSDWLQGIRY